MGLPLLFVCSYSRLPDGETNWDKQRRVVIYVCDNKLQQMEGNERSTEAMFRKHRASTSDGKRWSNGIVFVGVFGLWYCSPQIHDHIVVCVRRTTIGTVGELDNEVPQLRECNDFDSRLVRPEVRNLNSNSISGAKVVPATTSNTLRKSPARSDSRPKYAHSNFSQHRPPAISDLGSWITDHSPFNFRSW